MKKEAIITDLDGYMTDTTLVADNVTGVFPILQPVPEEVETLTLGDPDEPEEPTEPSEPEMITVGYTVAVKPPKGLYKLRYDLDAYHAAVEQYDRDMEAWRDEIQRREEEAEEDEEIEYLPPPAAPDLSTFWVEGYTAEELEDLLNPPPGPPTPTDLLGREMAQLKLTNIQQQNVINSMGTEITQSKLKEIQQQQVINSLGAELTAVKLDLINLKGVEGQ